jgi:hypothetical protein
MRFRIASDQNVNIMSLPLYPVASDGHAALEALCNGDTQRAAREREAEALAGGAVAFVTQSLGPLFDSEAEAKKVYAGLLDDSRVCVLTCRIAVPPPRKHKPTTPVFQDGVRWPRAAAKTPAIWQLSISYWKRLPPPRQTSADAAPGQQARTLRRSRKAYELTPEQILALTETPLQPARPQKALDFGLFDFIPPDNPDIVIADE